MVPARSHGLLRLHFCGELECRRQGFVPSAKEMHWLCICFGSAWSWSSFSSAPPQCNGAPTTFPLDEDTNVGRGTNGRFLRISAFQGHAEALLILNCNPKKTARGSGQWALDDRWNPSGRTLSPTGPEVQIFAKMVGFFQYAVERVEQVPELVLLQSEELNIREGLASLADRQLNELVVNPRFARQMPDGHTVNERTGYAFRGTSRRGKISSASFAKGQTAFQWIRHTASWLNTAEAQGKAT